MRFYAIIYDLRQPDRKYDDLYEGIKGLVGEGCWQHPMESFWVVAVSEFSTWDTDAMYETLRQHIDKNDSLFITMIDDRKHQGWMPISFWNWLKEKREQQ